METEMKQEVTEVEASVEPQVAPVGEIKTEREDLVQKEAKVRKRALAENGKTLKQTLFEDVLPPASDKVGMEKGVMQEELLKVGYQTTKGNPKVIIGQALWTLMKEGKTEKVKHGYWRLTVEATKERSKFRKKLRDQRSRLKKKAQKEVAVVGEVG